MTLRLLIATLSIATFLKAEVWIVKYETTEKCHECDFRYAVGCSGLNPDCGVPDKQVEHWRKFTSRDGALAWINSEEKKPEAVGTVSPATSITSIAGSSASAWQSLPLGWYSAERPAPPKITSGSVLLFRATEVPLKEVVTTREEPQPPKKVEERRYEVQGASQSTKK